VCWGDDISHQGGPMIRPEMYREIVKPRHRRLVEAIRAVTQAKIFFHSDGSVYWAIGDLIDVGIDILNPVQVGAANMDTQRIKREFGDHMCFWGAGCDSQHVLPVGTPAQVREEVRRRIEDLAPGGGYVFAPIHHIESEVPAENIVAMYEAAREYGAY
jgi:uroporphyrinogen decarboxylase